MNDLTAPIANATAPRMPSAPVGLDRWALAAVGLAAAATVLLLVAVAGDAVLAAACGAGVISLAALLFAYRRLYPPTYAPAIVQDWALLRSAATQSGVAMGITDRAGRLVCATDDYATWFGGFLAPAKFTLDELALNQINAASRDGWRDGRGEAILTLPSQSKIAVEVIRAGRAEDHLIWRFAKPPSATLIDDVRSAISGAAGDRLGEAGVMVCLMGGDGRIQSLNRALALRATGRAHAALEGRDFVSLLEAEDDGAVHFVHESAKGNALRLTQIALEKESQSGATLIMLMDSDAARGGTGAVSGSNLQNLLSMLPLGLALADRDGRFLFLNTAFRRAAGVADGVMPIYPGDLMVREDKAAVADAVRRFANGQGMSGDLAVRLVDRPEEPVALTMAGASGLGDAAVLLSLKDNSEEARLKREIAQATKMQAVGQLAGGVAHDFNNILTAVIGHCDLMMLRHQPGDSDYDDIQQIKLNSNRAANLTRQLLAFSRQQTLRPQVLQLPDVISEVSNMLQRVMGETVTLEINHGRDLGPVRADPGQLEQVIVNLCMNAKDAMPRGGAVLLQTYAFPAAQVRKLGSDIMPIADYTALKITDAGTGIPQEFLPKIFEPFFTTKEVGKGTGLGLSTVYGIVKQSGGFIFATSEEGKGTSFVIYLPVHRIEDAAKVVPDKPRERPTELWGSGTILLVEDEQMVRVVAERALARHGYTVVTASNGEEGLELLGTRSDFDLLISDVVMPLMDGPTMVRHARERFPLLPILFMSGYAEEQLRKSINIDNVNFIPKPFSVQQLAEAARAALAEKVESRLN